MKAAEKQEPMQYTSFEKARLIGARALQLSMGAPFAIEMSEEDLQKVNFNPIAIAKLEYDQNKIPIDVRRKLPE